MGVEERQYGKLGETVYEKKTSPPSPTRCIRRYFETRFFFETFGRLLKITYPDGEVVTNTYDSGGNLTNATGVKAVAASGQNHRYQYLQSLFYDKFEQRSVVTQGNGVKTAYTYDANTRRLSNLNAVRQGEHHLPEPHLQLRQGGNILGLKNAVDLPTRERVRGPELAGLRLRRLVSADEGTGGCSRGT